ncbi:MULTISPECIES: Sec-independent protein translocase subunit TatA/TatB [Oceanithermus]|uniref:Sec-independent protein translocase protein TatA n=1 Tax=Oceanithermus profundus (strain DSM 14977 / NBRC 100410 / VKM B-2274 / 506) TaxID=670487 RepID=E4UAF0_OCEP5|nr:twin-arginine translocase TatA/TatE family subunit [Oceanithermus profundus]ADR37655.1 Sec-independent protein translocase TatA [Oceanithermus profundus DSM 14977]
MNLGMPEILVILVIVLILFGPKKLPELARGLGQSIREFKKGASEIKQEFEQAVDLEPEKPAPQQSAAPEAEKKPAGDA